MRHSTAALMSIQNKKFTGTIIEDVNNCCSISAIQMDGDDKGSASYTAKLVIPANAGPSVGNCWHPGNYHHFRTGSRHITRTRHFRMKSHNTKCDGTNRYYCSNEAYFDADEPIFVIQTDEDFNEKVLNSSKLVLVDFHADWCGSCQLLGPKIEAKVCGYQGLIRLAKINVDYAGDIAADYDVKVVPTVIAFKDGEIVGRFEGNQTDEYLSNFLDDIAEK